MSRLFNMATISSGYGLQKGGITCILYNNLNTNLTVIYMETIPWYLRVYYSSVHINTHGLKVKPCKYSGFNLQHYHYSLFTSRSLTVKPCN